MPLLGFSSTTELPLTEMTACTTCLAARQTPCAMTLTQLLGAVHKGSANPEGRRPLELVHEDWQKLGGLLLNAGRESRPWKTHRKDPDVVDLAMTTPAKI